MVAIESPDGESIIGKTGHAIFQKSGLAQSSLTRNLDLDPAVSPASGDSAQQRGVTWSRGSTDHKVCAVRSDFFVVICKGILFMSSCTDRSGMSSGMRQDFFAGYVEHAAFGGHSMSMSSDCIIFVQSTQRLMDRYLHQNHLGGLNEVEAAPAPVPAPHQYIRGEPKEIPDAVAHPTHVVAPPLEKEAVSEGPPRDLTQASRSTGGLRPRSIHLPVYHAAKADMSDIGGMLVSDISKSCC